MMPKATIRQNDTLAARAATFALRAHDGQYRKGTKFPYASHPIGVGHLLRDYYPHNEDLEVAGYLHDVIEDTEYTYMDLFERFGERVAWLVDCVTHRPPGWRGGINKDITWSLEDRMKDPDVARLKAADVMDNVRDTIRGLQKGHDVWSRFRSGERKSTYWQNLSTIVSDRLPGEPIASDLQYTVEMVKTFHSA